MKKAFFSYSRQDGTEIADHFFTRFHNAGYDVIMDRRHLEPGCLYESELLLQIEQSDILFVFLTDKARSSLWVAKEIQFARETNTLIIPILCDDEKLPENLALLESPHLKGKDGWWRVVHALGKAMDDPATPKPRVVNLSPHNPPLRPSGILILNEAAGQNADISTADPMQAEAERLSKIALPMIIEAGAGIIPPSFAPIVSTFLAIVAGKRNQLPKLYWSDRSAPGTEFRFHSEQSLDLQSVREQARGARD